MPQHVRAVLRGCILTLAGAGLAGGLLAAPATASAIPVVLAQPMVVHSTGAELTWSPYDDSSGVPFDMYKIYRSMDPNFTPSDRTLIAKLGEGYQWLDDTTAAPDTSFTYRVVVGGVSSNTVIVTTPDAGNGLLLAQGRWSQYRPFAADTYVEGTPGDGSTTCRNLANYGAASTLRVGVNAAGLVDHALVHFDWRGIDNWWYHIFWAKLRLPYRTGSPTMDVSAYRIDSGWDEGTEDGTCNQTGASWSYTTTGRSWSMTPGGDTEPTPIATVHHLGGDAGTDVFDVTSAVQTWADNTAPPFGFLIRAADEPATPVGAVVDYDASESGDGPSLEALYTDGSTPVPPNPHFTNPQPGATVSGVVTVSGTASDDSAVDHVTYYVDGAPIGTIQGPDWNSADSPNYAVQLDTTSLPNGTHTLTMTATDNAGLTTSIAEQVQVANTPTSSKPGHGKKK